MVMALVEMFRSPQGEGYNAGRDAVFVRFAGCPLACEFAPGAVCDTPYQRAQFKLTVAELLERVRWLIGKQPRYDQTMVVLTGGEPTASPAFVSVVTTLSDAGYYVAVETNGTLWNDGLRAVDWIAVSPKDAIPQTSQSTWHNPHPSVPVLHPLVREHLEAQVEGRVSGGGEYRYVIGPLSDLPPWHNALRHYVSPAALATGDGREHETGFAGFVPGALARCLELISLAPEWRLSIQQHKLWGVR